MKHGVANVPLFAGVPAQTISQLTRDFAPRRFRPGEHLITQGAKALELFLLLEGKIETYYRSSQGEKTTIIYHSAPFITGEIELFDGRPYLANVVALEPCRTLVASRKQFLAMLQANHQVCLNLARIACLLLCETGEDRRVKFFGTIDNLLANLLCYQAKMFGEERSYGILLTTELNKKEIADCLGVARKSVIASFKNLEQAQLVKVMGRRLCIPDLRALQAKARNL